MAVRYYDEAIYNKIQGWVTDKRMTILKPDEVTRLFQVVADKSNDKPIKLPLIAISRDRSITLSVSTKRNLTYDGLKVGSSQEQNKTIQLNAIPITINYQIDIYTQKYEEADVYLREFIFQLINHPKLEIEIPYNGVKISHVANLRLQPEISYNSDISERLFPGQFTRWTLQLELQDAYLFNTPVKNNYKMAEGIDNNLDMDETIKSEDIEYDEGDSSGHNGFTHIDELDLT